jgi:hypothetical protein
VFGFEARRQPLLSRAAFIKRMAVCLAIAAGMVGVSLVVGMLGYRHFENMTWIDAFASASMILSGMGPLGDLHTSAGKLFAGIYALYSGLLLIAVMGLVLAPFLHRLMHKFHIDEKDIAGQTKSEGD